MLNYQPGFRPPAPSPAFGQKSPFLGQVPLVSAVRTISLLANPPTPFYDLSGGHPRIGQTFDEIAGLPRWSGDVLRLVFHGGTTWLGISVGLKEKKNAWVSGIAWVLAIGNGLAGIADLISLVKRAAGIHPPEGCPKAPVTMPEPVPTAPGAVPIMPGTRSF